MKHNYFVRSYVLDGINQSALNKYGKEQLPSIIPESVFKDLYTLVPIKVYTQWLELLEERTNDPDFMLNLSKGINIRKRGMVSKLFFSGYDLAVSIRRMNVAINCFQSGVFMGASLAGPYMKWKYANPALSSHVQIHDSVRMAIIMTKVLRGYLGDHFCPALVRLSGSRGNDKKYQQFFGCEVQWNQPRTEIWFHSKHRMTTALVGNLEEQQLTISLPELDNLLSMPDADDEMKVVYEAINYSRHFGIPKIKLVSSLLGVSEQQLQRKLRAQEINFSSIMSYTLCNLAINLFSQQLNVKEVSLQLGYDNVASFVRMFKTQRGITPKQYIERFHDKF